MSSFPVVAINQKKKSRHPRKNHTCRAVPCKAKKKKTQLAKSIACLLFTERETKDECENVATNANALRRLSSGRCRYMFVCLHFIFRARPPAAQHREHPWTCSRCVLQDEANELGKAPNVFCDWTQTCPLLFLGWHTGLLSLRDACAKATQS